MARILLAWQIGAGYGRIAQIAPVAAALHARGHEVILAAPHYWLADAKAMEMTRKVVGESIASICMSPDGFIALPGAYDSPVTYADILHVWSFDQGVRLHAHVQQWLKLFDQIKPDAVLVHHAPGAALSAQMAGLSVGQFGDGYVVPRAAEPLPEFTPWAKLHHACADCAESNEATVLSGIREVCRAFGKREPASLCEWLQGIPDYLCAFPFLDHYGERDGAYYYGVHRHGLSGQKVQWPAGCGPEALLAPKVLVYLSAGHPLGESLASALRELGWPVVMHQAWSEAPPAQTHTEEGGSLKRYAEPIDMDQAMSEAGIFICHAPHLSCTQALSKGLPMLLLPVTVEQEMVAMQMVKLGVAMLPAAGSREALVNALRGLLADGGIAMRAVAMAQAMKPFDADRAVAELADDYCHDMGLTE